jgi:hypothetical protein
LLGRFYILSDSLSFDSYNVILIFKNLVWAVMDLMTILSCGNESAKAFGMMPVRTLGSLISGTGFTSIFIGPAGLMSIASQFASSSANEAMQAKMHSLNLHKAWLIVERETAKHQWNLKEADLVAYDKDLGATDDQIEDLKQNVR